MSRLTVPLPSSNNSSENDFATMRTTNSFQVEEGEAVLEEVEEMDLQEKVN